MSAAPPPYRADHVGSLLRPQELLRARAEHQVGRIDEAALRRIEDASIRAAVRMQEDVGLEVVTDGEMRRHDWLMDFKYALGGVERIPDVAVKVPFESAEGGIDWSFNAYRVTRRLRLEGCVFGDDFAFLKGVARATPKLSIPSPSMMHYPGGRGIDRALYPDREMLWHDLAQIYAQEIAALHALGCTYLQIDDTSLAFLNDPKRREALGAGAETLHRDYIRLLNRALADKPAGMWVATHLCRGNYRSAWAASGGYDHVAEALFGGLEVDGFFLEYDDARSGDFAPLRFVPRGKRVVLGLVTSKRGALERKDDLKRRIDEAARYVPLDQLALSPQCGFASSHEGNALTSEEQRAKLQLVVETAGEVWR